MESINKKIIINPLLKILKIVISILFNNIKYSSIVFTKFHSLDIHSAVADFPSGFNAFEFSSNAVNEYRIHTIIVEFIERSLNSMGYSSSHTCPA